MTEMRIDPEKDYEKTEFLEIVNFLHGLLEEALNDPDRRARSIKEFMETAFNLDSDRICSGKAEALVDFLSELADDLVFYEANPVERDPEAGCYGDEELADILEESLPLLDDLLQDFSGGK
ncbi:MAG TPA: hypothetical protein PLA90_07630 [Candidatus Sumerlaeota bacterium]|nr:hypothetical protein [Candidatus Sumerlaeota bacterium]HPS01397.1 hypothetical protein [Candidatus Sumerlaeota bacterium]